jgi:hypothetical protein
MMVDRERSRSTEVLARKGWRLGALASLIVVGACSTPGRVPMQVNVTQLAPYQFAAKSPDCEMPVIDSLPLTSYREVAIVEVWADLQDDKSDVVPAMKRKACETGADALVITNSQHQDIKNFLYKASPNETLTETTQQDVYSGQGEYIKEAEHSRRIGEAGHNGYYVDGVAINYTLGNSKKSSRNEDQVLSRPNG